MFCHVLTIAEIVTNKQNTITLVRPVNFRQFIDPNSWYVLVGNHIVKQVASMGIYIFKMPFLASLLYEDQYNPASRHDFSHASCLD